MSLYKLTWWFDGIYCMHCKSKNVRLIGENRLNIYSCSVCGKKFTLFTNTPFERTKLTEEQWEIILTNFENLPSVLARKVGIHHWSMSKIMTKIRKHLCRERWPSDEIINTFHENIFKIAGFLELSGIYLDAFSVMLAFLYYSQNPAVICKLVKVPISFINNCFENIRKSWEPKKEFFDGGKKYEEYDDYNEIVVITHLYVLCLVGEITRDPLTGKFSCPIVQQGVSPADPKKLPSQ
jgi:transposase-like protein